MAKLYIYNTLTRRKEEFKPLGSEVGIYTVSYTHLTLPTNREV